MKVYGMSIPGHKGSKSEGSKVRMSLACSRNNKENVAGVGCSKQ